MPPGATTRPPALLTPRRPRRPSARVAAPPAGGDGEARHSVAVRTVKLIYLTKINRVPSTSGDDVTMALKKNREWFERDGNIDVLRLENRLLTRVVISAEAAGARMPVGGGGVTSGTEVGPPAV